MTREEQVDWLCRLKADLNNGVIFTPWNKEFTEALNKALEQEPCKEWHDVPSNKMTLEQARQAVKDLRKKLAEYLWQKPVLDKIRAEIEELDRYYDNDYFSTNNCPMYKCNEVLQIIDKHKAESKENKQ